MVESNWQMDLGTARKIWRDALARHDAAIATKAVAYLARRFHRRPQLSDLLEVIVMLTPTLTAPDSAGTLDAGKRGIEAPEWVWVWSWCRHHRAPRNYRVFPQQASHGDPTGMLTLEEYEKLRDEWIAAGKPKASHPIPATVTR